MLIDDIPEDEVPTLERLMTPTEDFHAEGARVEDEDNVGPKD